MNQNPKQSKAREILWLAIAAMSLATGIHKTVYVSFKESWYFYIFVIISLILYKIRKNIREKDKN